MSLLPLFGENFPKYTKQTIGNVNVQWYQAEFTQSQYPPGQEDFVFHFSMFLVCVVSEACTLICLLVAQRVSQWDLKILSNNHNVQFSIIIAEAIIEGNRIHSYIVKKKLVPHPYLNAEEALKFGGKKLHTLREWKFQVFRENLDTSLHKNIVTFLCDWYQNPQSSNLFMLMITCGRTILLIFQQKTKQAILFDSHGHNNAQYSNRGLVVAHSPIANLEELCHWYIRDVIHNCYELEADQYELACLYYKKSPRSTNRCDCRSGT